MISKLAVSALVAASLFGATTVASAQTEPAQQAPSASVESNTGAGIPPAHGVTKQSHVKPGMTTGMSSGSSGAKSRPGGESVERKPTGN
jgi:hypothetical protein